MSNKKKNVRQIKSKKELKRRTKDPNLGFILLRKGNDFRIYSFSTVYPFSSLPRNKGNSLVPRRKRSVLVRK